MSRIEVEGMEKLQGEIRIQGSKNAALPILAACVLNEGETILHGCPRIKDVFSMIEALKCAGAKVKWEASTVCIDASVMRPEPFVEHAQATRASVMLIGSFIGRFGKAVIGYPGGCCIGRRPIDLHEQTLSAMGVRFCEEETCLEAVCDQLEGCDLFLPYPSVGVTENILLAASKASGMTCIYGAAREPEIQELCRFLNLLGVRISGVGTDKLCIMGGKIQKRVEYTICTDRIAAGTYLLAVAGAGGEAVLKELPLEHMKTTIQTVSKLGAELQRDGYDVKIKMNQKPQGIKDLCTAPYPGFPTDLQSPLLAVLCMSKEVSCIEERIFENRFLIVEELRKMGANVCVAGQTAHIQPVNGLHGAEVRARELRGGAALVLAALGACGKTKIENAEVLSRGYEDFVENLKKLGANIRRF